EQIVLGKRLGVSDSGFQIKATVGIHAKLLAVLEHFHDGINAAQIFVKRSSANFLFHYRITAVDIATHLILQLSVILPRIVVAPRRIDEDFAIRLTVTVALCQQLKQWLAFD